MAGCKHYKRKCKFVSPCCNRIYTCRICHDEKESHQLNRKDVTTLLCIQCQTLQTVKAVCEHCSVRFGRYTCLECRLFDNEDKKQFHCNACGICRIGGEDNYFHCEICNICLPIQLIANHKCVENVSHSNCPVCLEDIHTSRIPCHIPACGHLTHQPCYQQLLKAGHNVCPTCRK